MADGLYVRIRTWVPSTINFLNLHSHRNIKRSSIRRQNARAGIHIDPAGEIFGIGYIIHTAGNRVKIISWIQMLLYVKKITPTKNRGDLYCL